MQLKEKLVQLRSTEGARRNLGRPLTQMEVVTAMREELGVSMSQAYLSQLEGGKRVHLSNTTREALSRFFRVHPGYLVSDPPDYVDARHSAAEGEATRLKDAGLPDASGLHGIPGFASVPGLPGMPSLPRGGASGGSKKAGTGSESGSEQASPDVWQQQAIPGTRNVMSLPGTFRQYADMRVIGLLSRLRDHPDSERVLLLVEQLLHLSREQLDALREDIEKRNAAPGERGDE
jgi:hypothetical protein